MSEIIRFIGDVHGMYDRYEKIIRDVPRSIQLGDMGMGLPRPGGPRDGEFRSTVPLHAMLRGDHRFIRGNHDNPGACRKHPQWIADGHFENGMMFVGGAVSVDRALRQEGYNWWADEELSAAALKQMVNLYMSRKPRVMVTHDCPEEVATIVLSRAPLPGPAKPEAPSRTRYAFQAMWSAYPPELWIFAHYHMSFDHILQGGRETGTRFICLAELEYRDIDLVAASRANRG